MPTFSKGLFGIIIWDDHLSFDMFLFCYVHVMLCLFTLMLMFCYVYVLICLWFIMLCFVVFLFWYVNVCYAYGLLSLCFVMLSFAMLCFGMVLFCYVMFLVMFMFCYVYVLLCVCLLCSCLLCFCFVMHILMPSASCILLRQNPPAPGCCWIRYRECWLIAYSLFLS